MRPRRVVLRAGFAAWVAVAGMTCRPGDVDEADRLEKLVPSGVSTPEAWRLFDRSVESAFAPTDEPVALAFDHVHAVAAVKVFGPAPYKLTVTGPAGAALGLPPIDASVLSRGWHAFPLERPVELGAVELRFAPVGQPGQTGPRGNVPEIELWGPSDAAPARAPDLHAELPEGYVASATGPHVDIGPGLCASFEVQLPARPELLRRAHLVYDATGVLRGFALRRTINGIAEYGGAWQPGSSPRQVTDEIDPSVLHAGANEIALCVADDADRRVSVDHVRLVGELDRGIDLAAKVTIADRDATPLLDRDLATSSEIGAGEIVRLDFDRAIAPDAIYLDGRIHGELVAACIDHGGARTPISATAHASDAGTALVTDGGRLACAGIELTASAASTISEIDVGGSGAGERVDWPRVVVTSAREHFGDLAWVGGFVARPPAMTTAIRVALDATQADRLTGDFGSLLHRTGDPSTAWTVPVTTRFPDGSTSKQDVVLGADHRGDRATGPAGATDQATPASVLRYGSEGDVTVGKASPATDAKIRLGTLVGLDVPHGAVTTATDLTVRHLASVGLPPLDDGMINVTGPKDHSFEFLPHGQRFARPVEILLPYDPALIPDGMNADDVHAYFYDPAERHWTKLERSALDVGDHTTKSRTTHFTIMINAVLAVPKSPTPLSLDPSALTSIAAASPAANIDLIDPPQVTSLGDARLSLPIRAPGGRGAYSPSLALTYDSGAGNGWVGVGWDLHISRVEIDTRFGVPDYDPNVEPRYVLDGAELVPTTETDGPTCVRDPQFLVGPEPIRRYRTRIEGAFAHILRCGDSPEHFHWEVRDRDGTLFVYGTGIAGLASYAMPSSHDGIFRFYLRDVVDAHGNETHFDYHADADDGSGSAEPFRELYLQDITYTRHESVGDGAYSIALQLDDHARPDPIISGRAGFKMVTRHLLRAIHVKAHGAPIRSYVLTYAPGQYGKSVLASVRVYGTSGCTASSDAFATPTCGGSALFHEHRFEYYQDPTGFADVERLDVEAPDPALALGSITRGSGSTSSFGIGATAGNKAASISAGYGDSSGSRQESIGIYDLNGDGLPDQLRSTVDGPVVLENATGTRHGKLFVPGAPISGLPHPPSESTGGWGLDLSGQVGGGSISAGTGIFDSTTRADRILSDLNGDGYVDYLEGTHFDFSSLEVKPPQLFLGSPCGAGLCFSPPQPFSAASLLDPTMDPLLSAYNDQIADRKVLGDAVVQWVAPYRGHVIVDGTVAKHRAGGRDGVSVEVYHQDTRQGVQAFAPSEVTTVAFPDHLELDVDSGDAIYVRVATGPDQGLEPEPFGGGAFADLIDAHLAVHYTKVCDGLFCQLVADPTAAHDPTRAPLFSFDSTEDFRVAGSPVYMIAPAQGTIAFHAKLTKGVSAADVRACVQKVPAAAPGFTPELDVPCGATGAGVTNLTGTMSFAAEDDAEQPIDLSIPVALGELVIVRVESDFSFDPKAVALAPTAPDQAIAAYSKICLPDGTSCTESTAPGDLTLVTFNNDQIGPFVALVERPAGVPRLPLVVPAATTIHLDPVTLGDDLLFAVRSDVHGLIAQVDCRAATCGEINVPAFAADAGESITFEVVSTSAAVPRSIKGHYDDATPFTAPIHRRDPNEPAPEPTPFFGGYHGWHAGLWNEREPFAPASLLADFADLEWQTAERRAQILRTIVAPQASFATGTGSDAARWVGVRSIAFVGPASLQSGYVGFLLDGGSAGDGGVFAGGYTRLSGTSSSHLGVTLHPPGFALGLTVNRSTILTTTDMLDMTGDGIADALSPRGIGKGTTFVQPAPPLFGVMPLPNGFRERKSHDYALAFGIGGSSDGSVPVTNAHGRVIAQRDLNDHGTSLGAEISTTFVFGRSETTADLVDLNGDGLPDFVEREGQQLKVKWNLGRGFATTLEPFGGAIANAGPIDGFATNYEQANALTSDHDALTQETTLTKTVTASVGIGVAHASHSTKTTWSRTTRELADLNGDGLPDIVVKLDGQPMTVQINLGGAFAPPSDWAAPAGWTYDGTSVPLGPVLALPFVDVLLLTGPDVLASTSASGTSYSGTLSLPVIPKALSIDASLGKSRDSDDYELALIDIDGDHAPDHLLRSRATGGPAYVKRNRASGKANLLRRVLRPLGGSVTLDYTRTGNTVQMPQSRHVLTRVEVDDGVDLGSDFASPNLVTTMSYEDGFYSRFEKEFFGFGRVLTFRADGVVVEDAFENRTYPLHGRLLDEKRHDSTGRVFAEHQLHYTTLAVLGAGDTPLDMHPACVDYRHPLLGLDACRAVFPVVDADTMIRSEAGSTSKRRVVTDGPFDRFGNVLASLDEADDATASDDVAASATYSNDTTSWILGRPTHLEVRGGGTAGPLLRSRNGTYNSQGDPLTISIDTGTGVATTQLEYDELGNLSHVTTPPNQANQIQTIDVVYDADAHLFPTSVTDGFGYTSTASYDVRFGVATTETDTNGAQLVRTLDDFGRLTSVRGPYDPAGSPAISIAYDPDASPPIAVTTTRASAPPDYTGPVPLPMTTVTAIDGLGRAIELRKTSVVDGVPSMTTSGLVARDAVGRVTHSYHPFFTSGASTAFAAPQSTPMTTSTFDDQDRVVTTRYPDGTTTSSAFELATAPATGALLFHAIATDENGHRREAFTDLLDRTRAFVEHPSPTTASVTRYDYLATGELAQIIDAEGHATTLGYDLRGLRTSLDNPDDGLIEDRFDLMGNHVALIEPNHRAIGAEVRYVYDRNRLAQIDYPSKPDVTFTYGAPGAPGFTAGRLVQVTDETGTQTHSYGALGEVRRTLRTVVDPLNPNATPTTFDLHLTSDSLGHLLRVGYPDGEVVTTAYDAAGMVSAVTGAGASWTKTYADQLRYDVFGNRTQIRFGNGAITTASFDPLRVRLAALATTLPDGTTKVQDLHYTYDPGGNPTAIANALPPPPNNGTRPGTTAAQFTYDGVDRLVHATGQAPLPSSKSTTYDLTFSYSASHNLLGKTLVHDVVSSGGNHSFPSDTNFAAAYTYAAARPHLPSRVGDLDLTYDPSGNPITRHKVGTSSDQQLVWDDDGRLVQIAGLGASQRNTYDAAGLRVFRHGQSGDTIFSSPYFDLEGSSHGTKHVFAGGTRVASVLRTTTLGADPPLPAQPGTAYFLHPDHLGSTGVVTTQSGTVNDAHEYFPDGELWIDGAKSSNVDGYLFNGKQLDPDTGFYDFGQRFYDPKASLWLGVDAAFAEDATKAVGNPLMLAAGVFGDQNPLRFRDLDGREAKTEEGKALRSAFAVQFVFADESFSWDHFGGDYTRASEALRNSILPETMSDRAFEALGEVGTGIADTVSFGIGPTVRRALGTPDVNTSSGYYTAGVVGAVVYSLANAARGGWNMWRGYRAASAVAAEQRLVGQVLNASGKSMRTAVLEINKAGLTQAQGVNVIGGVVKAAGKNLISVDLAGGAKGLVGVMPGTGKPLVHIAANGVASFGSANVEISMGSGGKLVATVTNVVLP